MNLNCTTGPATRPSTSLWSQGVYRSRSVYLSSTTVIAPRHRQPHLDSHSFIYLGLMYQRWYRDCTNVVIGGVEYCALPQRTIISPAPPCRVLCCLPHLRKLKSGTEKVKQDPHQEIFIEGPGQSRVLGGGVSCPGQGFEAGTREVGLLLCQITKGGGVQVARFLRQIEQLSCIQARRVHSRRATRGKWVVWNRLHPAKSLLRYFRGSSKKLSCELRRCRPATSEMTSESWHDAGGGVS